MFPIVSCLKHTLVWNDGLQFCWHINNSNKCVHHCIKSCLPWVLDLVLLALFLPHFPYRFSLCCLLLSTRGPLCGWFWPGCQSEDPNPGAFPGASKTGVGPGGWAHILLRPDLFFPQHLLIHVCGMTPLSFSLLKKSYIKWIKIRKQGQSITNHVEDKSLVRILWFSRLSDGHAISVLSRTHCSE